MVKTMLLNFNQNYFQNFYQAYKLRLIGLSIVALALSAYFNPQAFLNLWLTRDQQGVLLLEQGNPNKAALTFSDENWVAFSFYADGNFEQAASLFSQFEGVDAQFSQANALAHAGQYFQAVSLYQAILSVEPNHKRASDNLALMNKLIKKMKKTPGKTELSNEIMKNRQVNDLKTKPKEDKRAQSSKLWLEQVQQNPSKFLRKKFQQEHQNEQ